MKEMLKILKQVISSERDFFRASRDCVYVNPFRDIVSNSIGETYCGCLHPKANDNTSCRPDRCPLRGKIF